MCKNIFSTSTQHVHCQLRLDRHTVGQLSATLQVRQNDNTVWASLQTLLQLPGDAGELHTAGLKSSSNCAACS